MAGDADAFAVMNRAFAPAPLRVKIAGRRLTGPIVVVHWADGDDVAAFPQLSVELAADGEASVLEIVAGPGRARSWSRSPNFSVAPAARLSYLQVQLLGVWRPGR